MEGLRPGGLSESPAPAGPRLSGRASGIFPPGPTAIEEWRDILADYPWLAPSISEEEAQSFIRQLADGLAPSLAVFSFTAWHERMTDALYHLLKMERPKMGSEEYTSNTMSILRDDRRAVGPSSPRHTEQTEKSYSCLSQVPSSARSSCGVEASAQQQQLRQMREAQSAASCEDQEILQQGMYVYGIQGDKNCCIQERANSAYSDMRCLRKENQTESEQILQSRLLAEVLKDMKDQRTDALRMLGNGVVVIQCAAAFTILARRAGINL
jgi:hypothetical protein